MWFGLSSRRRDRRYRWASLCLLAVAIAGAANATTGDWSRLDTPSFTFFSNAEPDVTLHYAAELESFRRYVAHTLGDGAVANPLPTEVYLFADAESFEPFSLGERNVGWFTGTRQANVIAVDSSAAAGTEVAYHEYVHFVVENSTPAVPLWLNEGLAEFYSNLRRGDDGLELGRPLARHVDYLRRNRLISFDELFAVTRDSPEYTEERRRGVFYAQSWAFVHYLLVGQKELRLEVDDFFARLRDGSQAEEAYREAFGTSTLGLRRDLEHYVSQALFEYLILTDRAPANEQLSQPTELSQEEANARLGLLCLAGKVGGENTVDNYFHRALAIDPDQPTALRGMGELDLLRGDFAQAAAWFAEALVFNPDDAATLDLHALALLQTVQSGLARAGTPDPPQQEMIRQARESFGQAIAREPRFAPALAGYGTTFFWDQEPAAGIEVSARAVALLPRNAVILSAHLALVAQAGRIDDARRVYSWLHRPAVRPSPEILADAERALFNAEFQSLIRSHTTPEQYTELLAALEALVSRAPDALLQVQLEGQIEQLRATVERNRWADIYNRALALLKAGEHGEGLALLREVAAQSSDSQIAERAEDVLDGSLTGSSR